MPNEKHYPIMGRKADIILRHGKMTGNTTSNPTLPSGVWEALIKTATRSSTGVFALTFDVKYPELKSFAIKIVQGSTAYLRGEFTAIDVTAGTATLKTDVNGTLTDPGISDVIYIELAVRNSGRNK